VGTELLGHKQSSTKAKAKAVQVKKGMVGGAWEETP